MKKTKKKYKIVASFWYGKVYSPIIDFFFILGWVGFILPIGMVDLFMTTGSPELLLGIPFGLLCGSCSIWLFVVLRNMRRSISVALLDAIELEATAYRTGVNGTIPVLDKESRLTVSFMFDGKKKKVTSATPTYRNVTLGYRVFRRYENKKIKILYSPSQDHVLILDQ